VILLCTLLPFSFKRIAVDEVGIKYHTISKKLYLDEVVGQGNHYVQPGEKFFIFKSRFVTINFLSSKPIADDPLKDDEPRNYGDINCLTTDGLQIEMQITLQYILRIKEIPDLFLEFGETYEKVYSYMLKSSIQDSCGDFTAEGFYMDRGGVQQSMLNRTQARLSAAHADVGFLQLSNVQFPTEYSDAVSDKEKAQASVAQALAERNETLIASETQVMQAEQDAAVIRVKAESQANATILSASVDANTTLVQLRAQTDTYQQVMDDLGLTPQELVNFISIDNMDTISDLLIGTKAPGAYSFPEK